MGETFHIHSWKLDDNSEQYKCNLSWNNCIVGNVDDSISVKSKYYTIVCDDYGALSKKSCFPLIKSNYECWILTKYFGHEFMITLRE